MNAPPTPRDRTELLLAGRARLRGCLIGLAIICVLIPVFAVGGYAMDALVDAPWAYALLGRPTLTGTWTGEFNTPGGTHFVLAMDLRRKLLSNGQPQTEEDQRALLDGQAMWCDNRGRHADDVRVDGGVPIMNGYSGAADQVQIKLESASHPQEGLLPATFVGSWKVDTLALQPTLLFWTGTTFQYSSNNPDLNTKFTVVLKKADESVFRAACAELGSSAP